MRMEAPHVGIICSQGNLFDGMWRLWKYCWTLSDAVSSIYYISLTWDRRTRIWWADAEVVHTWTLSCLLLLWRLLPKEKNF